MPRDKKARNIFSSLSGLAFLNTNYETSSLASQWRFFSQDPSSPAQAPLPESYTGSSCPGETLVKCCAAGNPQQFISFFFLHKKPRTIKHFTLPTGISRFWIRSGGPSKSAATAQREEVTPVSSMASPRKVQCHGDWSAT